MTIIQSYDAFQYREVWKITQWKDGCIFKTKRTGKFIKAKEEGALGKNFVATSISTTMTKGDVFEIDITRAASFGGEESLLEGEQK